MGKVAVEERTVVLRDQGTVGKTALEEIDS